MTGLFERLARQVVGPEPPRARTVARLPFAAAPALDRQAAILAGPSEAGVRTGTAPEANAVAASEPVAPTPRPEQAAVSPVVETPRADARPAAVPGREAEPPGAAEATPEPAPGAPARGDDAGRRSADGQPLATEGRGTAPAPEAAAVRADSPPAPPRLLPEAIAPDSARPVAPTGQERSRPPREAEAPPEVHVHIGRIEVTSVLEPPPRSREQPRRGKEPMSLEQYLARRRSEGA